jgi:hypothetical protein
VHHQAVKEKEEEEEKGSKREGKREVEKERGIIAISGSLLQMICCN